MDNAPIRALREDLDLTQAELGDRLGVAQNTVSTWENGAPIDAGVAIAIVKRWPARCEALGITLETLVKQGRAA